ncbi:MAG: response regulator transcription factor [Anaerolineales bacterium]|nr:response regulator transcription factor [Anaerolineales bacterium]
MGPPYARLGAPIARQSEPTLYIAILAAAPALRSGLRALLGGQAHIGIAAEAASLPSILDEATESIDVLLIAADELPEPELSQALADAEFPPAVLLLSEQPEAARGLPRLAARAWGWLPPDCSEDELAAAINALAAGLITTTPALLPAALAPAPNPDEAPAEDLTERELDVLQLLAEGLANKQIALQLGISEHTVKFHSSAIYAKLGVTNRTEAVRRAARLGLLVL